ncbi:MAG: response regulator [Desulfobacterales bacterium]|uniref:Response regulator n=1 Tax=Candidatus Desulfatibia vada TaxID=2841696 RepID=A0A8J6NW31_9BACT|nr:response regulator [Candidatus Desulfatibia vada]MBL6972724.1 response regulator [Desulfobacterales bacterium]
MNTMKVLLVDDEEEFVATLAERLELREIQALVATDGESALALIEADTPQIVVLDIIMPGLGGLEVLKRIKAENPHIPVILLTGRGSTKEGIKGMQLGAVDYLMKPINIEELIKKMHAAIKGEVSLP